MWLAAGVILGNGIIGFKRFSNLIDVLCNWGSWLSVFCYNTLIFICYITLLYILMLMNKFTTGFSGEKSAQDTGSFENGNSVQKKRRTWFYVYYKPHV